jgi:hypothetical protein
VPNDENYRKAAKKLEQRFIQHVRTQERRDVTTTEREQLRAKSEQIAERNYRKK